jgi:PadR family transcriptional regulator, regulatory protein PadR
MSDELGLFEQRMLLAIQRKQPHAYGVAIQDELKKRTNREYSSGAIYATLERLEKKGFVKAKEGEATAQRGGRRKVYFSLTAPGHKALQVSLNASDALRENTVFEPVTT